MNLENLKEKLGDETFAELKTHIDDLTGQRDAARQESIGQRKGLKSKLEAAESAVSTMMEKLGIESIDQLETLPDAKGAAEAAKQYETKLKRMERQLAEATQARDDAMGKLRSSTQRAVIAEAIGAHDFIDREIVEAYVGTRTVWENDELLFKTDDGRLVPVKDGVAGFAKAKPNVLKSTGAGGAGVRQANAGGNGSAKPTISRKDFDALDASAKHKAATEMQIVD